MHTFNFPTVATAALFFLSAVNAESHAAMARRHMHVHSHKRAEITKRSTCEFPTDAGLVAVTPGEKNAGWAMSPDQPCEPGMYCPYACPPGQLMAQWDPNAKTYSYPQSMNGGLYCNEDGEIERPFPKKPYCYDGAGTVGCKNKAGGQVSVCQTVLPGNEAMLIPTLVESMSDLAVPDTSYWAGTAAHFYINPPGVNPKEACVWGTKDKPVGNWSPYVAGANEVDSGVTFVTIGWNPIYIEPDVTFRDVMPDWGVKIECEGGKCGGLPCYIDPNEHSVNEVSQKNPPGAGGANFCVVSVPKGAKANIIVFSKDGGSEKTKSKSSSASSAKATPSPTKSASSASKTSEATTTSSAKKTSSASSTKSSGSESSRTTDASSSTETDSPTSTGKKSGPEPTGTVGDDEEEEGSEEEGSGEEGEHDGDDSEHEEGSSDSGNDEDSDDSSIHPDDGAELYVVDEDETSSASSSAATGSSKQANGSASNEDGSTITVGPSSSSTDQPLSSGGSIPFTSATSVIIFSVFSALVIWL